MHIFEKFSSIFKKLHKHDQLLIIVSGICLIAGIIWGIIFLINKFTTVVPMNGGSIKYGVWEQPRIINPALTQNNDSDNDLIQLIYDGLLTIGPEGEIINNLASNLTVSKDGKIYEVKLNENILWHDGIPFSSEDVLFTIDMIQDYRNESPFYNIWKDIRVEKVGDYMVRFYLLQPSSQFKQNLTIKILPKHIWENINPRQYLMTEYNLKPVGTGPYKYKKLIKDKAGKIIAYYLEKNPRYFKHTPYINEIIFNFYDDADTAFRALIKGNIDLIKEVSYYQKELIKKRKSIVLSKISLPRYYSIFFNQKKNLWKNPNLIKALELAINKEGAVNESLYGEAEILNAPISKNFLGYAEKLNQKIYNKEEAKKILNDLGYVDSDNDGLLEKTTTTGKGKKAVSTTAQLELTLVVPAVNELSQLAQNIKVNLESIGIKTTVTIIPLQDIYKDYLKDRKYDAILFGEAYGLMPDLYLFWHSSQINDPGLNLAMFSDSNLDKLLEENRYTQDQQIIKDNLIKIQEILSEKKPAIFIANPYFLYAKDKNIKGDILNIINLPAEKFENIEDWYVNTRRKLK